MRGGYVTFLKKSNQKILVASRGIFMRCVGVAKASPIGGGKHVAGVQVGDYQKKLRKKL